MTTTTVAVACAIKTEDVNAMDPIRRYNRDYYERNERICLFVCLFVPP